MRFIIILIILYVIKTLFGFEGAVLFGLAVIGANTDVIIDVIDEKFNI